MKIKICVVLGLFSMAFYSCSKKKDVTPSSVNITATIDGVQETFNTASTIDLEGSPGIVNTPGTKYSSFVLTAKSSTGERMEVMLTAETIKADTTYTLNDGDNTTAIELLTSANAGYLVDSRKGFTITVSQYNSAIIQGTFSGNVYLFGDNGYVVDQKTVTNGAFTATMGN